MKRFKVQVQVTHTHNLIIDAESEDEFDELYWGDVLPNSSDNTDIDVIEITEVVEEGASDD